MLNQDNLHLIGLSILITCLLDMYWYYLEKLHVKHLLEFFFFFLTGSYAMLAKVKWVIKVGAPCYAVVLRCQQVTI